MVCGVFNRKGLLCSECYDRYGLEVCAFTNECINVKALHLVDGHSIYLLCCFQLLCFISLWLSSISELHHLLLHRMCYFVKLLQHFDCIYFLVALTLLSMILSSITLTIARTLSGIWNLDIGRYIIPSFCVSDGIIIHLSCSLLDYTPGIYQMILTFFTRILIKLHSSNFKVKFHKNHFTKLMLC